MGIRSYCIPKSNYFVKNKFKYCVLTAFRWFVSRLYIRKGLQVGYIKGEGSQSGYKVLGPVLRRYFAVDFWVFIMGFSGFVSL